MLPRRFGAGVIMRERITTDIYPTRYAAFDNPGVWALFSAAPDGTYRSCREDGPRLPRDTLGAGREYPGEMAVILIPVPNPHWPACSDGTYVEIGGNDAMGYTARCHHTHPTQRREQVNATFGGGTLDAVMRAAEEWIAAL